MIEKQPMLKAIDTEYFIQPDFANRNELIIGVRSKSLNMCSGYKFKNALNASQILEILEGMEDCMVAQSLGKEKND